MTFPFHPEAERDIADTMEFYAGEAGSIVAGRFLDGIERAIRLLVDYPDLGMLIAGNRRMFPLNVFPYALAYRSAASGIHILIVRHQHRKPGFGHGRR